MSVRQRDVIDVNRTWNVYLGSRRNGSYWHGSVKAATRSLAVRAARSDFLGTRPGYVEEQC